MHRPGSDPDNMQPSDFLCDFCRRAWDGTFALIEGHQGSLMCGRCLTTAYQTLVMMRDADHPRNRKCVLCLEERDQAEWISPVYDEAVACERCIRQAAQAMSKDPESGWSRPDGAPAVADDGG